MLRGTTHIRSLERPSAAKTAFSFTRKTSEPTVVQLCSSGTTFSLGFASACTNRTLSVPTPEDTPALHRHLGSL